MTSKIQPTLLASHLEKFKDTVEKRKKYVKNEYQAYGLELAKELNDWKSRALYIRLAKNTKREILEKARYFIKDQDPKNIKTPNKLFLWKVGQLKDKKD